MRIHLVMTTSSEGHSAIRYKSGAGARYRCLKVFPQLVHLRKNPLGRMT